MSRFRKHRFEALSDGIFAIAMTLLVLDLKVPEDIAADTCVTPFHCNRTASSAS